ncbi:hypothetical protein SEA_ZEPP_62 [Microbacterium phage Zepp]|nr:hypothetical protein SEA_ZEPP_62 [Microbacterium phage Zepp]
MGIIKPPCLSCGIHDGHLPHCPMAGMSAAQETMRQDMIAEGNRVHEEALSSTEAGTHKTTVPVHPPKPEDRAGVLGTVKVSEVLNGLFGAPGDDKEVTEEAYAIINELGTGLSLGLNEWAIVQRLVEAGIVSGRAGS